MKRKSMWKKVLVMGAAFGIVAGNAFAVWAEPAPEFDDYVMEVDQSGNLVYEFQEVQVTLPEEWKGHYGVEVDESVSFYHLQSANAYLAEGADYRGGDFFTLGCSSDYSFLDEEDTAYEIIGTGKEGIYYVMWPGNFQGYEGDAKIRKEYLNLWAKTDWVIDHMRITGSDAGKDVTGKIKTATSAVYVRKSTSTSSDIMGVLQEGEQVVTVGDAINGWIPVYYKGSKGYVYQKYLKAATGTGSNTNSVKENKGNTTTSGTGNSQKESVSKSEQSNPELTGEKTTIYNADKSANYIYKAKDGFWYDGDWRKYQQESTHTWTAAKDGSEWTDVYSENVNKEEAAAEVTLVDEEGMNRVTLYQDKETGTWKSIAGGVWTYNGNGTWLAMDGAKWYN